MNGLTANAPRSETELLARAHQIAGLTYAQLAAQLHEPVPRDLRKAKGWGGQLLELSLGATASSLPEPDFQQIGVELKSLPINTNGLPRESTYVCTVPLTNNTGLSWTNSWVRRKLARVLWIPVEGTPEIPLPERRIGTPLLWSPSHAQEAVLQQDWEELMDLVCLGQLAQISARLGTYLQIRPKAANARVLSDTFDEQGRKSQTLPRGFYLRTAFTRQILEQHYVSCSQNNR